MILFGLESSNDNTLKRLNKGITVHNIRSDCELAYEVGLESHITVMIGYPWETKEDAKNTLSLAKHLMITGQAKTLQATIVIPYPGTVLHEQSIKK